ncbi:FKBP-type peptidyl-prolyl cis-trans isomerase [Demequina sp.]|uniref:FKBP-type peptidyl-prolyl cis-trans isomerase n=1 Tax=Demequina sp. TaxID=2050685 RepID=UPI003D0A1579
MKTKLSVSIAAAAVAALVLAGCSSADGDASPSATASSGDAAQAQANAALEKVEWSEDADGVPSLTFDQPFSVDTTAVRLINEGDGDPIAEGDIAQLDYTITSGEDGSIAYSTYANGTPEAVSLVEGQIDPLLIELLDGAKVGTDFLYAAVDASTDPASTVIMAVTVSGVVTPLDRATGEAVTPPAGLPVVTLDADGKPSVEIPDTDQPTEFVAQPLIKGDGDVVEEGDNITVNYSGWLWDGTQFDSSWERGSTFTTVLSDSSLIEGWVKGLAGQTVGSQVLLVIPSDLAYGDEDSSDGTIPGGSTLVFVVDILATS